MHKALLLLLTLILSGTLPLAAQKGRFCVPGTVQLNDSTCMKATEVTVKEWAEFIANNNFDSILIPFNPGVSESISLLFADLKTNQGRQYFK